MDCPLRQVGVGSLCKCQGSPFAKGGGFRGKVSLRTQNSRIVTVVTKIMIGIKRSGSSNGCIALQRKSCAIDCYRLSHVLAQGKTTVKPESIINVANSAKHDADRRLRVSYGLSKGDISPLVMLSCVGSVHRRYITTLTRSERTPTLDPTNKGRE